MTIGYLLLGFFLRFEAVDDLFAQVLRVRFHRDDSPAPPGTCKGKPLKAEAGTINRERHDLPKGFSNRTPPKALARASKDDILPPCHDALSCLPERVGVRLFVFFSLPFLP